jgi:5-methylcytosine-specific restriction endonuclease McrA
MTTNSLAHLSDAELITEVTRLAAHERHATARLIASLAELDARRLYLGEGCSSLFTYCTQVLHLSEHAAYGRIEAARAARKFPAILALLADGSLTLTAVGLLAPHLTAENHRELFEAARRKSKREIELLVARLRPQPDVASTVRKLPAPTPPEAPPARLAGLSTDVTSAPSAPSVVSLPPRPVVVPLAPERYKVQFTVSRETYEKLRRAQDLLRHAIPNGDPSAIFDRALTVLLQEAARTKLASTERPRAARTAAASASRHIPAAERREVWTRDGGQCAFVGTGRRCTETGFLEFHHVVPYAAGGQALAENLELRCRAHNAFEAERYFGAPLFVRETRGMGWISANSVRTDDVRRNPLFARFLRWNEPVRTGTTGFISRPLQIVLGTASHSRSGSETSDVSVWATGSSGWVLSRRRACSDGRRSPAETNPLLDIVGECGPHRPPTRWPPPSGCPRPAPTAPDI